MKQYRERSNALTYTPGKKELSSHPRLRSLSHIYIYIYIYIYIERERESAQYG